MVWKYKEFILNSHHILQLLTENSSIYSFPEGSYSGNKTEQNQYSYNIHLLGGGISSH